MSQHGGRHLAGEHRRILVLGLGNLILSDDGVGSAVVRRLETEGRVNADLVDGGTTGLRLLPEIENRPGVVFVDAAQLDAVPGRLRVFEGADFDAFLGHRRPSAHDVGLHDLVTTLRLQGTLPPNRALVAVQPGRLDMGDSLSDPVVLAVELACREVHRLIAAWSP